MKLVGENRENLNTHCSSWEPILPIRVVLGQSSLHGLSFLKYNLRVSESRRLAYYSAVAQKEEFDPAILS
jgi:hypothetical protein